MTPFRLLQYQEAGCPIVKNTDIKHLCTLDHDCDLSFRNGGGCVARINLIKMLPKSATNVVFNNTVAEEAKRLGLSKSEIRRRRAAL